VRRCTACQAESSTGRCDHCGGSLSAGDFEIEAVLSQRPHARVANLLLRDDGEIALIDFDSTRELVGGQTHGATLVGTVRYMPIEQYGGGAWASRGCASSSPTSPTPDTTTSGATTGWCSAGRLTVTWYAYGNVVRRLSAAPPALLHLDHHGAFPFENLFTNFGSVGRYSWLSGGGAACKGPHSGARGPFWNLKGPAPGCRPRRSRAGAGSRTWRARGRRTFTGRSWRGAARSHDQPSHRSTEPPLEVRTCPQ
jgi:hypothetical protein